MKELDKILEGVEDEKSFLVFVRALIEDRRPHENKPTDEAGLIDDWVSNSISDFLESAVAWAEDSDFGISQEPELRKNKWKQFAIFLYCGKIYE